MFHGTSGQGQLPGQNEPGYSVAGECYCYNGTVQYSSTLVTSYIDINTGEKLKADVTSTETKYSTDTYTTSGDDSLGTLVATPANATGFCEPGVTNVVYLYNTGSDETTTSTTAPTTTETTTPTTADTYILGDANNNGEVNISDVTYIQQFLANLTTFNADNTRNANVDGDSRVSIKDASFIQRYLLSMTVPYDIGQSKEVPATTPVVTQPTTSQQVTTQPTTKATQATQATQATTSATPTFPTFPDTDESDTGETKTVLFSNSGYWSGTIYCYHWLDGESPSWPGDAMTKVGTNEYGQDQYSIEVPVGSNIIFTNGTTQTVDLVFNGETGFYPDTTNSEGKYTCGSW
jgi:hypothetical protein